MPYIDQKGRDFYERNGLEQLVNAVVSDGVTAGDLNYLFTRLAMAYTSKNMNYQKINDVLGALEGAKLEFYRKRVSSYEDIKEKMNGPVY